MRLRYSEEEIIKTTKGDHNIYSGVDISENAADFIRNSCDGHVYHGDPDEAPELRMGNYFVKGEWRNHKGEPITRAVYGQKLQFYIEFDLEYAKEGHEFEFALYDDDRNDYYEDTVKNVDDFMKLVHPKTNESYKIEKVGKDGKNILKFSVPDLFGKLESIDNDKIYELYFRCTYKGETGTENVDLPARPVNYLRLGALVIDRFKMPGLNPQGTDIADDMTFGTGYKYNGPQIYPQEVLQKFKNQYQTFGFHYFTHRLFSNEDNSSLLESLNPIEIKQTSERDELYKIEIDNTRVATHKVDIATEINNRKKWQNKNRKAKYSKDEIYNTKLKWFVKVPYTDIEIISGEETTGRDVEEFSEHDFLGLIKRDDDYLFRIFKDRAESFFARGEMQDNLHQLIDKFKRNEGGVFESQIMTNQALSRKETDDYCQKVEDYIAEQLKINFSNLEKIEDVESYFEKIEKEKRIVSNVKGKRKKEFTKPTYSYGALYEAPVKGTDGLTIALNDIWATEVLLQELIFDGDNYTAKYEVILWDHFGLDLPDLQKIFNIIPLVKDVFVCWFILQHLRGFKPFLTKLKFEKKFSGNLQEGVAEREKMREGEREQKAKELNQKMRDDMLREPKF
ncbi:DUF3289 family protein [Flavobacterium sp. GA093]|uniref:DUF3289 family protein n=1 Tax=Flavobacterium hydrocarbonoxydans TaxID=2683249 RepID=A0A6I4NQU6_9FLAO|nr:DUF3289 family protein [Flavobacterium hydrocarbonoxydans]MWB96620.1 DUF3289 family protein [Flavobacterium hydrocarbonoxydans]